MKRLQLFLAAALTFALAPQAHAQATQQSVGKAHVVHHEHIVHHGQRAAKHTARSTIATTARRKRTAAAKTAKAHSKPAASHRKTWHVGTVGRPSATHHVLRPSVTPDSVTRRVRPAKKP